MGLRVAALFAGIGGIEKGLHDAGAGHETTLFCESWEPARTVLEDRFDAPTHPDVRTLPNLPDEVDTVTAGFPCTDLSQAGKTAGIKGAQSGLVSHVLRLMRDRRDRGRDITWLAIENVSNMLALDKGEAMRYLVNEIEDLGSRWAYRVVDSRFTGVPQRRKRVILLASSTEDPRPVLFADDVGERTSDHYRNDAFGFYWTEGRRGLGWAVDAVPTLKGGSTVGIPSPPGIWVPSAPPGQALIVPSIEDAEELQGFPRGWTQAADGNRRNGPRWKLVGNAVTVGVSRWLGQRIDNPGAFDLETDSWEGDGTWPTAAWGEKGVIHKVAASDFPLDDSYRHLLEIVDSKQARPVSHRGASGFWSRLQQSNLGRHPGFREAVAMHVEATDVNDSSVAV